MTGRVSVDVQMKKLREIRDEAGMNRRQFSEYMEIPLRTMEEWESGRRKMPAYLLRLIEYKVRMEKIMEENKMDKEN